MSRRAGVRIEHVDAASDVARALVEQLDADLDERYREDDELEGEPDRSLLNLLHDDVRPPHGTFLVAFLEGAAVGCGAVRPAPAGPHATAEIKRMYVAPPARRRGISRALLGALEDAARELGYRRAILETGLRQAEAMALYESAGYTPIAPYGAYQASALSRCYEKAL